MIKKLNHVAIAVADVNIAAAVYKETLGATISKPITLSEHGVITVFVELNNTKIELLQPLTEDSPIYKFLQKNPAGGMHHICYEVENIHQAAKQLQEKGARILGDIKIGAHNKPVLFLHPKDFCGTLIELEQSS